MQSKLEHHIGQNARPFVLFLKRTCKNMLFRMVFGKRFNLEVANNPDSIFYFRFSVKSDRGNGRRLKICETFGVSLGGLDSKSLLIRGGENLLLKCHFGLFKAKIPLKPLKKAKFPLLKYYECKRKGKTSADGLRMKVWPQRYQCQSSAWAGKC